MIRVEIVSIAKNSESKQLFTDRVRNDKVRYDRVRNDRVRNDWVRNDRGLEMIVNPFFENNMLML